MNHRPEDSKRPDYRCPLCGRRFTEEEAEACKTCPYLRGCRFLMCPGCGYEFPKIDKV